MKTDKLKEREVLTGHAIFSPSQLYRIILCPASVQEATYAPIPEQSVYAARGTRLHDVVVKAVDHSDVIDDQIKWTRMRSGEDFDDSDQVVDCLDYRKNLIAKASPESRWFTEQRVTLATFGLPEVYGTADFSLFDTTKREVHVVDWKFGSGVQVFAEKNVQGMTYAAGVVGYPAYNIDDVIIHVVQPPLDHFDAYKISYEELKLWVFSELEPAILKAKMPNPAFNPGKEQCKFCPSAMTCRARLDSSIDSAKEGFKIHSRLNQVTKDELAKVYKMLENAVQYRNDIAKFIELELSLGRAFPGYKLVSGRSNRKWVDEEDAMVWLEGHSAVPRDQIYTKKAISISQAEKHDKSLKKNQDFKALTDKPPGKDKVVEDTDPRESIKPTSDAKTAFEGV